ncbi:MAG TPA: hypothetical protein VMW19_09180 [Myxococcota bacterium]|nr:hypothetical protein [Myxococcota bacterium]
MFEGAHGHWILLHVGLPKTATTALQDHVFAQLPGARSVGKPEPPKPLKKALRRLIGESDGDPTRSDLESIRAALHPPRSDDSTTILSHEGLTATRHELRDGDRFLREKGFRVQRVRVARRLREACDAAAQVLFTVREQCSWLLSLYSDLVLREGLSTSFDSWVEAGLDDLDHFSGDPDFHWLVDVYATEFGAENVHVLPFEDLRANGRRFAAHVAAAGGLDEGELLRRIATLPRVKTTDELRQGAFHVPSRHTKDRRAPGHVLPEIPAEFPSALREKVRDLCRAGNRRLVERFGAALEEHDYAL